MQTVPNLANNQSVANSEYNPYEYEISYQTFVKENLKALLISRSPGIIVLFPIVSLALIVKISKLGINPLFTFPFVCFAMFFGLFRAHYMLGRHGMQNTGKNNKIKYQLHLNNNGILVQNEFGSEFFNFSDIKRIVETDKFWNLELKKMFFSIPKVNFQGPNSDLIFRKYIKTGTQNYFAKLLKLPVYYKSKPANLSLYLAIILMLLSIPLAIHIWQNFLKTSPRNNFIFPKNIADNLFLKSPKEVLSEELQIGKYTFPEGTLQFEIEPGIKQVEVILPFQLGDEFIPPNTTLIFIADKPVSGSISQDTIILGYKFPANTKFEFDITTEKIVSITPSKDTYLGKIKYPANQKLNYHKDFGFSIDPWDSYPLKAPTSTQNSQKDVNSGGALAPVLTYSQEVRAMETNLMRARKSINDLTHPYCKGLKSSSECYKMYIRNNKPTHGNLAFEMSTLSTEFRKIDIEQKRENELYLTLLNVDTALLPYEQIDTRNFLIHKYIDTKKDPKNIFLKNELEDLNQKHRNTLMFTQNLLKKFYDEIKINTDLSAVQKSDLIKKYKELLARWVIANKREFKF